MPLLPFSLLATFIFLFLVDLFLSIKVYFNYLWCTVFSSQTELTKTPESVVEFFGQNILNYKVVLVFVLICFFFFLVHFCWTCQLIHFLPLNIPPTFSYQLCNMKTCELEWHVDILESAKLWFCRALNSFQTQVDGETPHCCGAAEPSLFCCWHVPSTQRKTCLYSVGQV